MSYFKLEKYHEALDYALKTIKLLLQPKESTTNTEQLTTNNLSFLKQQTGLMQKDVKQSTLVGDQKVISETYRFIGDIYEKLDKNEQAISNYEDSLKISENLTPIYQSETVITYTKLAQIYRKMNCRDGEAMNYYTKALKLLRRLYLTIDG
ncbi:unnamed protein product [Didymodactylos carnosus]|uniref:Tetratricopeptide repeat protein n=1 Tax=Didymodactylos carnosus TaxID=1234261 RepID=A0A814SJP7_9BILA|nr:unnamed protein product [Didymodactylos carnosus]CAF3912767.1 unnamed protein product [Didymodactylos carnosus]